MGNGNQGISAGFNPSYVGPRFDVVSMVPPGVTRVLDVGCSIGSLGEQLKSKFGVKVVGVEIDERMARIAETKLDKVIAGDIESLNLEFYFSGKCFDCIIFADVLEHLRNPWNVLKELTLYLDDKGVVIASLPNIRHYSSIINLVLRGYWPYRERGIHDRTHLRFFTLKNIRELFDCANLAIVQLKRNYRIIESPHYLNKYSKLFALPVINEFLTFQYLVVAKKVLQCKRDEK